MDEVRFTEKMVKESLKNAASHHIESFDFGLKTLLPRICKNMSNVEVTMKDCLGKVMGPDGAKDVKITKTPFQERVHLWFESFELL